MSQHITYDPVYNTVDRDDFRSMLDVERYGQRSSAFDADSERVREEGESIPPR